MIPFTHNGEEREQKELQTCLCLSKTLLDSKRPADALHLIDRMVARFPAHTRLLHLRGQALQATNNGPAAFATFMSVLSIDSNHVPSMCSVGEIYKAKGMLQESLAAYTRAREVEPDNKVLCSALAAVLTDLGTKAKSTGALQEGMALYQSAIEHCPEYAPAYYNIGVLNSESHQFDAALEWYHKATQLHPMYAEAHCNVGVILKERGELEAALEAYNSALAAAPNFSIVHGNLAIVLTDLGTRIKMEGRIEEGIALYERALAHNPKYADALYNLGVAHGALSHHEKAIFMYETAIQHNPKCAEALNNLGVIYKERDNLDKAMECYSAALTIKPNFPQSLNNMGVIFTAQGRAQEALTLLTAAIVSSPTYAEAHNNLGVLQRDVGAIPEALASYSRCLEIIPDSRNASQNRLLALNYIYCGSDPMVCEAHAEWGARYKQLFTPLSPPSTSDWDMDKDRTLRVGYISPDLFTHSVSYFAEAPLSHHRTPSKHGPDEGRIEHFVYCCTPKLDAKTARLKAGVEGAGGTWRDVASLTEPDLAQLIRDDRVDILVELTGHTANNRLGTMAMRPAPIQATWIGYPNSTGLEAIDYRLTDEKCDPLDTEQTFVEELIRLPGCFLCYTPAIRDQPPVSPLPALQTGYVTFGSFNNLAKITPEVLKLWARILLAVPSSRLMLKSKPFACETARNHFLNLLLAEGVESWRVDLVPLVSGTSDHLATYSCLDISLDPFPYAGTTTTCESFFMGVPCISLAGGCHAYNVGVSLLASVGLEEDWVAHTQEQYVDIAVKHANQLQNLATLRSSLRARMLESPLCDAPPFIAHLEHVYRQLWHRYVQDGDAGMEQQRSERLQRQQRQMQQRQQKLKQQQTKQEQHQESTPESTAPTETAGAVMTAQTTAAVSNGQARSRSSSRFAGSDGARNGNSSSSSGSFASNGESVTRGHSHQEGPSEQLKDCGENGHSVAQGITGAQGEGVGASKERHTAQEEELRGVAAKCKRLLLAADPQTSTQQQQKQQQSGQQQLEEPSQQSPSSEQKHKQPRRTMGQQESGSGDKQHSRCANSKDARHNKQVSEQSQADGDEQQQQCSNKVACQ